MSWSNYLENKFLDKVFNNVDFSIIVPYVGLHTGDPGKTGGYEASGAGYTRQAGSFTVAFGGQVETDSDIVFLNLPSGTYTHVSVWDTLTSGNYLWGTELIEPQTLADGDGLVFYTGNLYVTIS